MYFALAWILSSCDFELYETDVSDVEREHAYLVPYPNWEFKSVRVTVKQWSFALGLRCVMWPSYR